MMTGTEIIASPHRHSWEVQAQTCTSFAAVEVVRFAQLGAYDQRMRPVGGYRLDLCLTPRPHNARACYHQQWGPHRFEALGDVFLLPPNLAIHTRGESGRQVSLVCELSADSVEHWLDHDIEWTDRRLEASLDVTSEHIRVLLGWLAEETSRPHGKVRSALIETMTRQLALELARFCSTVEAGPSTGGLGAWQLRTIDERLRGQKVSPSLAELAQLCNLSVRQLTRGFRVSRGCSIANYIARGRMDGAKRLLSGSGSIEGIAFALGFTTASSFAHAFRRETGVTPRQFRQRAVRAIA